MTPRILSGADLPPRLRDLPEPPAQVHVRGDLPRGPAVAIVGTRHPSKRARAYATKLARRLASAGVAVFSGGAKGIDAAAHEGALLAAGATVVVAPAGFLAPFPSHHRELFDRVVASGGAYLSLVPDHQTATRAAFFSRNACLAALTHAVVIVEGSFRSGARNTTRWARELGRPFFAVPAAPWHKRGGGCLIELRLGARLCTRARDVLEVLEESGAGPLIPVMPPEPSQECPQVPLPFPERSQSPERLVLDAVRRGARNVDEICDLSGLGAAAVQRHVLTLTLEGVLAPDPAGALAPRLPPNLVSLPKLLKSIDEKGDSGR